MAIEQQIWINAIKEGFIPDSSFLSRSVDMSEFVEYNQINLAEAGVDPDVLIDNKDYPVGTTSREDIPLSLALHTFDTKNTVVRNIEQKESSYDKVKSVTRSHKNALLKKVLEFAAHSWCPAQDGEFTPVQTTTGAINSFGRRAMTFNDLISIIARYQSLDVDVADLTLVLSPEHLADLRAENIKMYKDMISSGEFFGVKMYNYSKTPRFNVNTNTKKALGAVIDNETDGISSLIYHKDEVMRAFGDIEAFLKEKDPAARGDIFGYQQRFAASSIRNKYIGAIYYGKVTEDSAGSSDSNS